MAHVGWSCWSRKQRTHRTLATGIQTHNKSTTLRSYRWGLLAGHQDGKHYFNTRTQVIPSNELRRETPLGKWCYDSRAALAEAAPPGKHKTALAVLQFMCELNDIFLQDTAAMMVLHPERSMHPMHDELPFFKGEHFLVSLTVCWPLKVWCFVSPVHSLALQRADGARVDT